MKKAAKIEYLSSSSPPSFPSFYLKQAFVGLDDIKGITEDRSGRGRTREIILGMFSNTASVQR